MGRREMFEQENSPGKVTSQNRKHGNVRFFSSLRFKRQTSKRKPREVGTTHQQTIVGEATGRGEAEGTVSGGERRVVLERTHGVARAHHAPGNTVPFPQSTVGRCRGRGGHGEWQERGAGRAAHFEDEDEREGAEGELEPNFAWPGGVTFKSWLPQFL